MCNKKNRVVGIPFPQVTLWFLPTAPPKQCRMFEKNDGKHLAFSETADTGGMLLVQKNF